MLLFLMNMIQECHHGTLETSLLLISNQPTTADARHNEINQAINLRPHQN